MDQETGECGEQQLNHSDGEAERFYRDLRQRGVSARVGMETTGRSRWLRDGALFLPAPFLWRLLGELYESLRTGGPASQATPERSTVVHSFAPHHRTNFSTVHASDISGAVRMLQI